MSSIPTSTKLLMFCLGLGVVVVGVVTVLNITISPADDMTANGSGASVLPNSFVAGVIICISCIVVLEIIARKKNKKK